jgi:hypothetical protein
MKNLTRIAGITVACSLALGLVIRAKSTVPAEKFVVSQQSTGSSTTVADTLSPDEEAAQFKEMNDLRKAGLLAPAKMPYCCDPTATVDPTLDRTLSEPDNPAPDTSPSVPETAQPGYVIGQGCTRGADGVLVCPPDQVAPIVSAVADRGSNAAGWFNRPVTVRFVSRDPLPSSGKPVPEFPPSVIVSSQGQDQLATSLPSCDPAGNCASGTSKISIDSVNPSIQVSVPANSATYLQGSIVLATYSCADTGSGIKPLTGCAAEVAVGASIDTSSIGPHSFLITANDIAGNNVVTTVNYAVVPAPTSTTTSTTTSPTTSTVSTTTTSPANSTTTILLTPSSTGVPVTISALQSLVSAMIAVNGVGNATPLNQKLASGQIAAFKNQVEVKCCLPTNGRWFTRAQADRLISLANAL